MVTTKSGDAAPTAVDTWMLLTSIVFDHRSTWAGWVSDRTGMPFSRYRALRRIESAPLSASVLAERLGVDAPAASLIVSDLASRGYVVRASDPHDGRRKIVSITPEGRALLDGLRATDEVVPQLDALTDAERTQLYRLLTKVQGRA